MSLFIGVTPVREPDQKHGQRYPRELVPVKKRKTEEDWIVEIVEWDWQQRDERYQQQPKTCLIIAISPSAREMAIVQSADLVRLSGPSHLADITL
jgi:hypothetical protein